jgi:hypothetical protein
MSKGSTAAVLAAGEEPFARRQVELPAHDVAAVALEAARDRDRRDLR